MAIKILSVDDEPDLEVLLSHYFRRKIRKGEYEFTFAHNGLEALKLMVEHPDFDIVLSDINMPEMDGLTLLSKINELRNPAQKCIMVSAYGDMKNIRTAMNRGAFDFATKPIDMEDLSLTIEKAVEEVNYIKQTQREHLQLESIQSDLAVAGEIQKAILPCRFPPFPEIKSLDIYASMTPAKEIGGDFYDFFRLDDGAISFFTPSHEHQSYNDRMHGGLIMTLMDEVAGPYLFLTTGIPSYTGKMETRFRSPVLIGETVKIICHETKRKGMLAVMEISVLHEDGSVAAEATSYMMFEK